MNTLLALARAAHYAGAMVVLGELVFLSIVRPAGVRQDSVEGAGSGNRRDAGSGRIRIIGLSLAIAVAADCMWLGAEAGVMHAMASLPVVSCSFLNCFTAHCRHAPTEPSAGCQQK